MRLLSKLVYVSEFKIYILIIKNDKGELKSLIFNENHFFNDFNHQRAVFGKLLTISTYENGESLICSVYDGQEITDKYLLTSSQLRIVK